MRAEVKQLRLQLLADDQENQALKLEQQQTDEALSDLLDKIDNKEKGYTVNPFSLGIKEIRNLTECRGLAL